MAEVNVRVWVLQDAALKEMLRRVAEGESAEIVYVEFYANSATERTDDDG